MAYVIVTARGLIWTLASLASFMLMLIALMNPRWLIGLIQTSVQGNTTIEYLPSVGVYTKCGKPINKELFNGSSCTVIAVNGFATDSEVFPNVWKASTFFIALGLSIMAVSVILAFCSFCFQSICKKSIYNIVGAIQALAGNYALLCYTRVNINRSYFSTQWLRLRSRIFATELFDSAIVKWKVTRGNKNYQIWCETELHSLLVTFIIFKKFYAHMHTC